MLVWFKTRTGTEYELDHSAKTFRQIKPLQREGPLWNRPEVRVGETVSILTKGDLTPLRVIDTALVTEREVLLG